MTTHQKLAIKWHWFLVLILIFAIACDEEGSELPSLSIESEIIDASSFGANDGAINISLSGGQEPFYYSWSNGDSTQNLSNVTAGNYDLTIIYGERGAGFYFAEFIVGQPQQENSLSVPYNVTDASYPTAKDGIIAIDVANIAGGQSPYTFTWANGGATSFRAGLFAGTYTVTVKDATPSPFQREVTLIINVDEPAFVCGNDSIIDVDGNRYATTLIAGNCWIRSNLRTTHYSNGITVENYNCYQGSCTSGRGVYYSWYAVADTETSKNEGYVQGPCPDGWHVPSDAEWSILNDTLKIDGVGGSGTQVKSKVTGPNSPSGLDIGYWGFFGFTDILKQEEAIFWSSTDVDTGNPSTVSNRAIYYRMRPAGFDTEFRTGDVNKNTGLNCRCMQNEEDND